MDALTSAQVTTTAGQADGFQLTFALSEKSALNQVLLPAGYFDPGIRVIVMVILGGCPPCSWTASSPGRRWRPATPRGHPR